jgi:hypothetical protein
VGEDGGATRDAFDPGDDAGGDEASLTVPLVKMTDGGPDWEETAAEMRVCIATLDDLADTDPAGGRFKRDNAELLEQMRQCDRDAWTSVELRLADRDRELREAQ